MSSSVHGASAELIGEVSRRDGGVGDAVSTPSSLRATPPMCSANRGRQSWGQRYSINPLVTLCHSPYVLRKQGETILPAGSVVALWGWHRKWEECSEMSSSVHGASAELIGEVSRRDGGVGDTCSIRVNPLVTLCHSPYVLRKQGETIMGSDIRYQPPRHFVPLPLYAPQTGGDNLASRWSGVGDTASTPSSLRATPPICSANRGRQSWGRR